MKKDGERDTIERDK